jgi:hypothetical protein
MEDEEPVNIFHFAFLTFNFELSLPVPYRLANGELVEDPCLRHQALVQWPGT